MASRWSETREWLEQLQQKHFPPGSNRATMVSGAFWSLSGAVFSRGLYVLTSMILARILGKACYGQWGIVLTAVSVFAGVASLGLYATITQCVAEYRLTDRARAGRVLSFCLAMGIASLSIFTLVCFFASSWVADLIYELPDLAVPLQLASLFLATQVLSDMAAGALAGFEDFRTIARNNVVEGAVLLISATPLTYFLGLNGAILGIVASQVASNTLALRAVLAHARENQMPLSLKGIWQEHRVFWHLALPRTLIGAMTGPASMLSQALASRIPGGLAGLGGYQASMQWRGLVMFVPQAVHRISLPILSRLRGAQDYRRFVRALGANLALNGGVALGLAIPTIALGRWILGLYGPDFRDDWNLLAILVGSAVLQAVNDVVVLVTASMQKMWWNLAIHVAWATIFLAGTALLTPVLGITGYALAFAAATANHMLINMVAAWVLLRRFRREGQAP